MASHENQNPIEEMPTDALAAVPEFDAYSSLEPSGDENIHGLNLKLESGEHLIVRDTSTHFVPEVVKERTTYFPHFKPDNPAMSGRALPKGERLPQYEYQETRYKKVGLPRFTRRDGALSFERRQVERDRVPESHVTYEVRDKDGNLIDLKSEQRDDFFASVVEKGVASAVHNAERIAAEDRHEQDIALSDVGDKFSQITEQLEDNGITNWAGLTWIREPIFKTETKTRSRKRLAQPGESGIVNVGGISWEREPMIEVTEEVHGEEPSQVKPKSIKGSPKRHDNKPEIMDVVSETREIVADEPVRTMGLNGRDERWIRTFMIKTTQVLEDGNLTVKEERKRDYELWEFFEEPTDGLTAVSKMYFHEPEIRVASAGHNKDSFVMPDGLHKKPEAEPDIDMVPALAESLGQEQAGELQKILSEYGPEYFDKVAKKLHRDIYDQYVASAELLGLPSIDKDDASWTVESLVKRSMKYREEVADPLTKVLAEKHLLRSVVDDHIGKMFGLVSITTGQEPVEVEDEDGSIKQVMKTVPKFDHSMFDRVGETKNAAFKKLVRWRNQKIWDPVEDQARKVFGELISNDDVDYEDAQKLGRLLRRTVAQ